MLLLLSDVYSFLESQKSSSQTEPSFSSDNLLTPSDTSINSARLTPGPSAIESSGVQNKDSFDLQNIINNAVNKMKKPGADETDGNDITAVLNKLNLPVSGPGAAASSSAPSIVVSSGSTTPSIRSRTPSPWTDDDLPEVLPSLKKEDVEMKNAADLDKDVVRFKVNTNTYNAKVFDLKICSSI